MPNNVEKLDVSDDKVKKDSKDVRSNIKNENGNKYHELAEDV